MDFCHIAPISVLSELNLEKYNTHLVLAHLLKESPEYLKFYRKLSDAGHTIIMDNSAFELYSEGKDLFDETELLGLAKKVKATYVVLPDYPGEPGSKTIKSAERWAPIYKDAGFGTFFVPQSEIGDLEDYIRTFAWAASSPLIDYIGVSILAVPNAYRAIKPRAADNPANETYRMQRYLSRSSMMSELYRRGILHLARSNNKKIHFLGMLDGPQEIPQVCVFSCIDSWDSSAAVWFGMNGNRFDDSPTGLRLGKYHKPVDFGASLSPEQQKSFMSDIKYNMEVIDTLVSGYNEWVEDNILNIGS